jgi:hypothetical protein
VPAVPPAAITIRDAVTARLRVAAERPELRRPALGHVQEQPIHASSTISDVEPDEMKGSGTPVSGARPSTV